MASALVSGHTFAHNAIVDFKVSPVLADKLKNLNCPETEPPHSLGADQLAQLDAEDVRQRAYIASKPELLATEGLRVYLTFQANGDCRWCPSGNNIEGIISRSRPDAFLCGALRVELTESQHASIYAFFKWAGDSF